MQECSPKMPEPNGIGPGDLNSARLEPSSSEAQLPLEHIFAMLVKRGYFGHERFSTPAAVSASQI
jgi:hypothetical protein